VIKREKRLKIKRKKLKNEKEKMRERRVVMRSSSLRPRVSWLGRLERRYHQSR